MSEKPTETLFIINEGPYGNERAYNALRLARNLARHSDVNVRLFVTGDGVACAKRGQETPNGYYSVERMLSSLARRGDATA